jgi:hypothetical protein
MKILLLSMLMFTFGCASSSKLSCEDKMGPDKESCLEKVRARQERLGRSADKPIPFR